jgi:hypothetical protein
MIEGWLPWIAFNAFVLLMLALANLIYRFYHLIRIRHHHDVCRIKMSLLDINKIPVGFSLAFDTGVNVLVIVASLRYGPDQQRSCALKDE